MKKPLTTLTTLAVLAGAALAVPPPGIVSTQGRISVGGANYGSPASQTGHFKAALVSSGGTETYWTNDGTNTGTPGGEPTSAVPVPVTNGHYSFGLGDTALTNMTSTVPALVFEENPEIYLRLWFDTTTSGPFELLTPDRRITSDAFALFAARAGGVVAGTIDSTAIADGAITTAKIADEAVTTAKVKAALARSEWSDTATTALTWDGSVYTATVLFEGAFDSTADVMANGWSVQSTSASGFTATLAGAGSFSTTTADSSSAFGSDVSLAIVNDRPAISYYDSTNKDLRFKIAGDGSGESWPSGNMVIVDSADEVGLRNSLAVVDGRPAISYYDATNDMVKFAIAADAAGTSWPMANIVTVDNVGSSSYTSLAVVDGRPAILYLDGASDTLKFIIASDAAGTTWPPGNIQTVDTSVNLFGSPSLGVVDGRPAAAYYDAQGSFTLSYAIAADAGGTSWPAANIKTVHTGVEINGDVSLAVVDGRPAIGYPRPGPGQLWYAIASDASGSTWPSANRVMVDGSMGFGVHASLAVVGGRPAIAYDTGPGALKFVTAADVSGTIWPAGNIITVDSPVGDCSLGVVGGLPAIAYYRIQDLNFARLAPPSGSWTASDPAGAVFPVKALGLADKAIGSANFQDGAVTTEALADGSVTSDKLAAGAIDDSDADPGNELQDLSLAGDTLSISGGVSADLGQYLRSDVTDTFTGSVLRIFGGSLAVGLNDGLDDEILFDGFAETLKWEDAFTRLTWSDDLAIAGALQTGQATGLDVPYNRLGTNSGGVLMDDASDLLISGSLEVDENIICESGLIGRGLASFFGDMLLDPDGVSSVNPEAELHVFGAADPTIKIQSDGNDEISGRVSLRQENESGVDLFYDGTAALEGFRVVPHFGGVADPTALYVSNRNNGTRGQVGIGTDAPSGWLEVSSAGSTPQIIAHQETASDFARIRLTTAIGGEWGISAEDSGTGDLRFYNGSVDRMILEDNGDLNIDGVLHAGRKDGAAYHTFANFDPTPDSGDMTNDNDVYVGSDLEVEQSVYAGFDVRIGDSEGNHQVYFYEDGTQTGEFLTWNNAEDRFVISDALALSGPINAGSGGDDNNLSYNFFSNSTTFAPDSGQIADSGDVYIRRDLEVDETIFADGGLVNGSDRNRKENIAPVRPKEVLAKVAALPISQWNYIDDESKRAHIGPMAQDFHAAFRLGDDDKRISTVDADGVALAAIQALKWQNDALKRQNALILKRLEALERELKGLTPPTQTQ